MGAVLAAIDVSHVVLRWGHIAAAAIAIGGAIFVATILTPALRRTPGESADAIREAIRRRWAILYHVCVLILLGTGLFNYMAVTAPLHRGQASYNALVGVKIILAFVVFLLGSALVGKAAMFEPIRRAAPKWLAVNIALALIVVAIGCWLKFIPVSTAVAP